MLRSRSQYVCKSSLIMNEPVVRQNGADCSTCDTPLVAGSLVRTFCLVEHGHLNRMLLLSLRE